MSRLAKYKYLEQKEKAQCQTVEKSTDRFSKINRINKLSPKKILDGILDKTIEKDDLHHLFQTNSQASWLKLYELLTLYAHKSIVSTILNHILTHSDNFIESTFNYSRTNTSNTQVENVLAIKSIANNWSDRVREIETWKPERNNKHLQLVSLLEHLYCKFPVPLFLVNSFTSENQAGIYLFIHIGKGGSLKDFLFPPNLQLNKKVYHYLFSTPQSYSYLEGFRRAQVLSMGGNERLFYTLQKTQEIKSGLNDKFWVTVIDLYAKSTMFDYEKIPEINDFIRFKINNQKPTAPFSMKGRSIGSLLKQSNVWHREEVVKAKIQATIRRAGVVSAAQRRALGYRYTPPVLLPNWKGIKVGNYNTMVKKTSYQITQILSHQKLIDEGVEMKNCVGSYASSCASGLKAIFSLKENGASVVTIEVNDFEVVQIKKKGNLMPLRSHVKIIVEWATKNKVAMGKYI